MTQTIDTRVLSLEFRADAQDEKMKTLEAVQKTFGDSLTNIEKVLNQIKWALYGAGLVVAVNFLGLKEVVTKLVLH
jgi:hypothetical protein